MTSAWSLLPPWLVRAFNIDASARMAEWAADGTIAALPRDECEAAWVDVGGES